MCFRANSIKEYYFSELYYVWYLASLREIKKKSLKWTLFKFGGMEFSAINWIAMVGQYIKLRQFCC